MSLKLDMLGQYHCPSISKYINHSDDSTFFFKYGEIIETLYEIQPNEKRLKFNMHNSVMSNVDTKGTLHN